MSFPDDNSSGFYENRKKTKGKRKGGVFERKERVTSYGGSR